MIRTPVPVRDVVLAASLSSEPTMMAPSPKTPASAVLEVGRLTVREEKKISMLSDEIQEVSPGVVSGVSLGRNY